ncbi:glycosyltransferase family 2 protein [Alicyclobacillus fastidiosus]|uniref:Glycosyltransferase family 2 protein n=1 Tax=Alicyclobacillus fastidiosus TaxID=392011 RepID=A0ABY6ZFT8_9BACL|nr:glycosyltransferase family 2 protein [Alicyclobacillus fastidiosus]WAH41724.1 glycosyltransferase family 2 protein [Alicyclobacillus fastidiosus]GMA63407.1 glycosyl transferase [Alicyclobacillus fastidiosus]
MNIPARNTAHYPVQPNCELLPESGSKERVRYSVVIPVYNEQEVLATAYDRLKAVMDTLGEPYELIFVNDGSKDVSREILERLFATSQSVKVLNFSRNFGHQVAISAGMDYASGDAVIVIDADLQDPPELILKMVEAWRQGNDVVYAKRTVRQGDTRFKRWTAALFYRSLRILTDVDIPVDTGDFRLIDRKVCAVMKGLKEKSRFVRGLVSWVGFRQTAVEYVRDRRFAGETKYPLKRMLRLSSDAITSFSEKPLKMAMYVGAILALASIVALFGALCAPLFTGSGVSGLFALGAVVVFVNSILLIAVGILGQYVARIHDEARDRPLYILESQLGFEEESRHGGA